MIKKIIFLILLIYAGNVFAQEETSESKQKFNSLLQPISVTVGGNFISTGSFPTSATMRLDQFVTQLYSVSNSQAKASIQDYWALQLLEKGFSGFPLRDITLKRIDGSLKKIDLLKFRLTGDFENNPFLKNDDVIIFPDYDVNRDIIDISGAVNKHAKIQFVEGDHLLDAILFAGGINPSFDNVSAAVISRLDIRGINEIRDTVNISDNPELKRGDRITILSDENQKRVYKALVLGEVKNPGIVYLKKDGTSLKNVINYSGGFTSEANLKHAQILRPHTFAELAVTQDYYREYLTDKNQDLELEKTSKENILNDKLSMLRMSNLSQEDSLFFDIDNTLRAIKKDHLVDFSAIYSSDSDAGNFMIQDGDVILVPQKFDYIYVFGQIPRNGYIPFKPGEDFKYYISQAGGLSETARDYDEVTIIKGDNRDWITENKQKVSIEPGDYIYVPKEIPRTFNFYLSRVSSIFGIVGSIATIVLLLVQFGK